MINTIAGDIPATDQISECEAMRDQLQLTYSEPLQLDTWGNSPVLSPARCLSPVFAASSTFERSLVQGRKRGRDARNVAVNDEDSFKKDRKRSRRQAENVDARLACPFVKHDPVVSPDCWNVAVDNLARLK